MPVGIICCRVLESEVRRIAGQAPEVTRIQVMDWGLHIDPERLLAEVCRAVRDMAPAVDAVVLGYGRCQTFDRLPGDLPVPVFRPEGEDCIGVLLGQDRYAEALAQEAGTWFLTPGWTELGMEYIFQELQLQRLAEKGVDPLEAARRMLRDFTRALFVDVGVGDRRALLQKAGEIAETFHMRLERASGSLERLIDALERALGRRQG